MKLEDYLPADRAEVYRSNWAAFEAMSQSYRTDSELRDKIDSGDVSEALADLGISVPSGMEARIVCDTDETHHFILPPDPNTLLSDESLGSIAGGKSAGSAGTAGTASTMACTTTPSSASSASSAATAGTAS